MLEIARGESGPRPMLARVAGLGGPRAAIDLLA
jgi:hypothetical protein